MLFIIQSTLEGTYSTVNFQKKNKITSSHWCRQRQVVNITRCAFQFPEGSISSGILAGFFIRLLSYQYIYLREPALSAIIIG